jgi:hypothetical protein
MKAHPAPFKKQGRRSVGYFSAGCLKIASEKEGAHSNPQRHARPIHPVSH